VSCPIYGEPNEIRNCNAGISYDDNTHRVIGFNCAVTSSSCQFTVTLCELATTAQSQRNANENCPNPCSSGNCPPGYTHTCVGDQQPDPQQCNCCVNPSPIVVDLAGDRIMDFSSSAEGPLWDINGLGMVFRLGWPLCPGNEPFLALDRNGNGRIDDGRELFGNATPLRDGRSAANGFEALERLSCGPART
jgi:hypothetical protein